MAFTVITTDDIGAGDRIVPADGDIIIVKEGVVLAATGVGGDGIEGFNFTNLHIFNNGTVYGEDSAIEAGTDSTVEIGLTGSAIGGNYGILFSGDDALLVNYGTMSTGIPLSGGSPTAVFEVRATATGTVFLNAGNVTGQTNAISILGAEATITNSGTITAYGVGIELHGNASGTVITNSGMISSDLEAIFASSGGAGGLSIQNSGTITTNSGTAIESTVVADIINSGEIFGDVDLSSDADKTVNSGQIYGVLELGGSDDAYIGILDGIVIDGVYGEDGLDTLKGSNAEDLFYGGDGLDTLKGGGGNDELHGEGTGDMIFGGGGNDLAFGGSGSDTLHGGDGADELQGGAKNDTLKGQNGNDLLIGNSGDDKVYGGSGEDVLIGGSGVDGMNGGAGADIFVFESTSDTGTGSDRDSIRGFNVDEDTLDFSQIDFNLIYIGTDSFNGTGDTEVRLKERSNGNTNVSVDVDGNGTTDMEIILFNTLGLSADNFLL